MVFTPTASTPKMLKIYGTIESVKNSTQLV